ncbi:hypothetical protein T07_1868 [Trichinella nelsoni]|uniref:WAP domain-containing protein n=1 Tax=Trichinella nelsoni TaxID=6336 RepID=A0A0V0RNF2_9BILA|nr:hypothetical protein T07_1868 [Trichinella nelsoni]
MVDCVRHITLAVMFFAMLHIVANNSGLTCRVGVWGTFPLLKMKMIMNTLTNVVANGKFDKAGLCPLPPGPTVSNAINYCNQDDDCKDAMKCCPTILGRRCMNPDSKRIICPDGSKAQQTCNADSDCHNNLKCTNGICCPEKKDSNDDSKSGSCPQLIVPSGYAIGKDDECRGDLQCSGKRKCCQTLAGKRCLLPV